MTRTLVGLAVVAALAVPAAWTEELPAGHPNETGFSAERLQRISAVLREHVAEDRIAGVVALVARRGKVGYFEAIGMQDREKGIPIQKDTVFRIYSMTKAITSVAVMILYEEGRFALSDPVSRFIPELGGLEVAVEERDPATGQVGFRTVPSRRDMTIRDLLRHTSGLTYEFYGETRVHQMYGEHFGEAGPSLDLVEAVRILGTLPLRFEPGTAWEYSRATDVLGRLIEVVSGESLDVFFSERIFGPLAMADTGFWVPEAKAHRLAALYTRADDGTLVRSPSPAQVSYFRPPALLSGGGGLVSTASDYARFCQMLLGGGELDGVRLLSRKTVELMTCDHLHGTPLAMGYDGMGFGLGFLIFPDPGIGGTVVSEGSYAWGGAASTRFWVDPAEELLGVFMIQILPDRGVTYGDQFRRMVYAAIAD